jgi:Zn-dependent M28 family amino/carboxypeptidase
MKRRCVKLFAILILVVFLFPAFSPIVSAQVDLAPERYRVNLQRKNPLVEEIVSKVSLEIMSEMHDQICSFETRNTFSDTVSQTRGIGAARRWIYGKFQEFSEASGGRLKVYYDEFDQELTGRLEAAKKKFGVDTWPMVNVVAVLPGKTDDLRFIVNGHYDTIPSDSLDGRTTNPGANDDASGTIATLELARVLSQYEFDHTLIFAADDAEEHGLLGAQHMARTAVDEKWEIGGVIADDMIGNVLGGNGISNDSAIRVFSPGPADSQSRHFARYAKFIGEAYTPELKVKMIFRLDRFGRGGHSAFIDRGFAGVRFTELNENFANQHGDNTDTIDKMSRQYMYKVTKMQAAILATAAMAPKTVDVQRPARDRSDYSTVLRWTHNTLEKDIAGYKIFIRQTDCGYWQEIVDIGTVEKKNIQTRRGETEVYETKLYFKSVDDYIFGVAVYDRDGNISIVSTYQEPQSDS